MNYGCIQVITWIRSVWNRVCTVTHGTTSPTSCQNSITKASRSVKNSTCTMLLSISVSLSSLLSDSEQIKFNLSAFLFAHTPTILLAMVFHSTNLHNWKDLASQCSVETVKLIHLLHHSKAEKIRRFYEKGIIKGYYIKFDRNTWIYSVKLMYWCRLPQ